MNLNLTEGSPAKPLAGAIAPGGGTRARVGEWVARHPLLALVAMAVLAVTVSSYPIIFCGKSYVSLAGLSQLVYDQNSRVPGMARTYLPQQHGNDPGAMMWGGVPFSFIESRSIMDHGEIPLWNRYGHAGDVLLGQAVTMLGDPLQFIVIFGRGSAIAWDIKFLVAKWLFCLGFGWLVLKLLGNVSLALIYTALAAWCGAYIFIGSHPAFFVLAYAPWILLSALEMLGHPSARVLKWGLVWLVANVSCFYAGHLEMAVDLIGGLNFAALISCLASGAGARNRARIMATLAGGTLLFLGLTAPLWLTFLASLQNAYATSHDHINITQIPAARFPGMFDDCFYHYGQPDYIAAAGTSLLVLAGCVLSLLRWRQLRQERFFWINTAANVFWAAGVFGGIPASLIATVPFVNRVGHIHVDFSYLLVIHLTLQSAYGFKSLLKVETFRQAAFDFFLLAAAMELMLIEYYCETFNWPHHARYFLWCLAGAVAAPVLFKYLHARNGGVGWLGWSAIVALAFIPNFRFGLYNFGNAEILSLPGPRVVLNAPSPVLTQLKNSGEPFRVAGLKFNLAGDYAAVYALEDIRSCAPLSNEKYIELVRNFPGFSLHINDWAIQLENPGAGRPLLNLLNVKYLLANPHTRPPGCDQFTVRDSDEFAVMENKHVWPRAFFTKQLIPVSSNEDFTLYLLRHGDQPFAAVDRELADGQSELRRLEDATDPAIVSGENYRLLPNTTAFDIKTTAPGVVCLTEGQAHDFLATANGQPVTVFTVNRAFKGVYLAKPGNYHVEFRYRPHFWGLSLSLFGISSAMVLFLGAREFGWVCPRQSAKNG